ncbi:hypothetical protein CONPUDRAFT_147998, partial [Coniophora puteana RWD-64-598 SS2]
MIQCSLLDDLNVPWGSHSYVDSSENMFHVVSKEGDTMKSARAPMKYHQVLHTLSYKIELYKGILNHLRGEEVINVNPFKLTCTQTRVCVLIFYLFQVRDEYIAEMEDPSADRSPTLEYHVWLHYTGGSFSCKAARDLQSLHGVTFDVVKSNERSIFDE